MSVSDQYMAMAMRCGKGGDFHDKSTSFAVAKSAEDIAQFIEIIGQKLDALYNEKD